MVDWAWEWRSEDVRMDGGLPLVVVAGSRGAGGRESRAGVVEESMVTIYDTVWGKVGAERMKGFRKCTQVHFIVQRRRRQLAKALLLRQFHEIQDQIWWHSAATCASLVATYNLFHNCDFNRLYNCIILPSGQENMTVTKVTPWPDVNHRNHGVRSELHVFDKRGARMDDNIQPTLGLQSNIRSSRSIATCL